LMSNDSNSRSTSRFDLGPLGGFLGIVFFVLAALVGIGGVAFYWALMVGGGLIANIVLVPFAYVGWKFVRLGRRLRSPSVKALLARDRRAPVIYLRSFEFDKRIVGKKRVEERNTMMLNHLGPVITVAKPGEKLPQLGAARIAFDNGSWQAGVQDLIQSSQLIVLQAGGSQGLRWEMNQVFGLRPFRPVLISAPVMYQDSPLTRPEQYGVFRRAMIAEAPAAARLLPEELGNTTYFFFPTPDRLQEFRMEGGPPGQVLDQLRPGTSAEIAKQTKRNLRIYFVCLAVFIALFMGSYIFLAYQDINAP
jgi:hypothetical protein